MASDNTSNCELSFTLPNGSRLKRLRRNRSCLRLCFPTCLTRPVGTSTRFCSFNYPRPVETVSPPCISDIT